MRGVGLLTPPLALMRVALRGELVLRILAVLEPLPLRRLQEVRRARLRRQHELHAALEVNMTAEMLPWKQLRNQASWLTSCTLRQRCSHCCSAGCKKSTETG